VAIEIHCFECGEVGHGAADCPKLVEEQSALWRELIKPLVLQMHRDGYKTVMIKKDGGRVQLFVE
jgi:hypothetical protein